MEVIVVTFEGERHVGNCLGSLQSAATDPVRVVVIDNASRDGTAEVVRREFPAVQLLRAERNLGYGAACNLAASASQSEYLAFVNQDVQSTPGWIEKLVAALDTRADAALATPKILIKDNPARINTCGNEPHYTGITRCRGYDRPSYEYAELEDILAVSGAAFVIRRSVFEALQGFDPRFFLYFEDTDLSIRARLAGYRCLYVPNAIVLHEFTPRFTAQKIRFLEQNRIATWLKAFRWRTLALLSPALFLTEGLVWAYCLIRGPTYVVAKAHSWARVLACLPTTLRQRRAVQRSRQMRDRDLLNACNPRLELDELEHRTRGRFQPLLNAVYAWWYACMLKVVKW